MSVTRFLTGITTSGTPHLGNYVGSIRPSVRASLRTDVESFYFLADYHALIKVEEPARIQRSTVEIAASWLAAGLDPHRVTFYRQSDIPEIPELTWFLTCVTGKGILNRAHAYKAAVDKNVAAGSDTDSDVTAGLFMYPVLMGADILMFNAHKVPVGRDQVQHLEMARDMAASFNHRYGAHFLLPEVVIEESVATLPGIDGRKMSKSYDNHIPLFATRARLKKLIGGILTDSRAPGESKAVEGSSLFQIFQAFASDDETQELRQAYADGIGWADAKQRVFERLDRELTPMRERYETLMRDPGAIEDLLLAGAAKARRLSTPFMEQLRHAVGLRSLRAQSDADKADTKAARVVLPSFKQYRESDGRFHFKLVDTQGRELLKSQGFASPKDAGAVIRRLHKEGVAAWQELAAQLTIAHGASSAEVAIALEQLAGANAAG
ncbi:MAG: tryptophan--tRNA ligase [Rhodoferax sp.]|nr:tryptophan--tRNA ligase [Rhodoferax sp.]